MVADKGKKPKTEDDQQIDVELVQSIEKLQEVQDELEKVHIWGASGKARLNLNRVSLIRLPVCYGSGGGAPRASTANVRKEINEEASDKVLEIEQKYNVVRKPVYDKRNEIIKSIPDFWPTAFLSHPALANLLTEEDQKIFKHLTSLEVEDTKDVKSGYSITFNFSPNPYFEDTKLTKTITFLDEETTKITATPIRFVDLILSRYVSLLKGIQNGVKHEKKGKKRSHEDDNESLLTVMELGGDVRYLEVRYFCSGLVCVLSSCVCLAFPRPKMGKMDSPDSEKNYVIFFSWFSGTQKKDDIDDTQDGVAEMIKEDLWVNPLNYFNNDADEEDFSDEDDEEDIGTEDSADEEDDDDDEDE
ncbi:NAP1-related protein 2 [Tanacetum coccineum]